MITPSYLKIGRLGTQITAETAVTASVVSTTETVLAELLGGDTLPANFFATVGKSIHFTASGRETVSGIGGPTSRYRVRFGGTGINGTVILDSGAMGIPSAGATGGFLELSALIKCVTTGATGTLWSPGHIYRANGALTTSAGVFAWGEAGTVGAAAAAAVTVDLTAAAKLWLTVEYSANTAGNSKYMGPGVEVYG